MSWISALTHPRRLLRILTALVTVASWQSEAHAQTATKRPKIDDKNAPATLSAEQMTGHPDREIELERDVEVIRGETTVNADKAIYRQVEDEVEAEGHVRILRYGDRYKGDELKLNLDSGAGYITHPEYKLQLNNAQGKAERVDFENQERATVIDGTYSTCEGPDPDWYLKTSTLKLDRGTDVGLATKSVVFFKGIPILGLPLMSFPLSAARKSGVLPPTIGATSKGGPEFVIPYYFNIAPNRDLTLYPKLITRRGLQLGANGRYLGETYSGETNLEVLPNDQQTHTTRYAVASTHNQTLAPGLSLAWNLNTASDNDYPSDFAQNVTASSQRLLLREVNLNYGGAYWNANLRTSNYKLLQDPITPITRPYDRLPQLTLHAGRDDVQGFDWSADSEITRFMLPDEALAGRVRGDRVVVNPRIAYPLIRPGYFVTPKFSLHATSYTLENPAQGPANFSRVVPTFSLDSGLVFERDTHFFGSPAKQTLEPRLFYVNTPFRDQRLFPNFDSAEATFNFAQIFSENRFSGSDRISDANQLTAALVSRYLEPSGAERLRLAFGQRFFFNDQRVSLDSSGAASNEKRSDLLLAADGRLNNSLRLNSAAQYSQSLGHISSANLGVQWQPAEKRVLNAEYRFIRGSGDPVTLKQVNLSGQWPVSERWYAVGRVSYSLPDRKTVDSLFGAEYKADCWIFRLVGQRFATATQVNSSAIFLQLELNGLSRLGSSPLEALRRNIPGYQQLNQSGAASDQVTQ
jgi:LPS-assembly protein